MCVPGQIVGTHCASLLTNRASSRTLNPRGNDDPWSETKLTLFFIWFFFLHYFLILIIFPSAHIRAFLVGVVYIVYVFLLYTYIAVFWFRRNFRFSTVKPSPRRRRNRGPEPSRKPKAPRKVVVGEFWSYLPWWRRCCVGKRWSEPAIKLTAPSAEG